MSLDTMICKSIKYIVIAFEVLQVKFFILIIAKLF